MNAIVSVTADWGIGHKGNLLVRNREDMRFFRETTKGGTVICGRNTFETFPGGALKGRRNIVLTGNPAFQAAGVEVAHDIQKALELVEQDDPEKVWLIGGELVYRQLLPYCTSAYVTKNEVTVPADAFFPNLDESTDWHLTETRAGGITPDGIPFSFCTYKR